MLPSCLSSEENDLMMWVIGGKRRISFVLSATIP
jgi:hypothetical protein